VGVSRESLHDVGVDEVDHLMRPSEPRTGCGIASKVQGTVVVLDLANVVGVGVHRRAGQHLLDLPRRQRVAFNSRAA